MKYSYYVKNVLWELINELESVHWLFVNNPEKDFTRKKKWDFSSVMKFIISMEGKCLKEELLKYFRYDVQTPTNSSFNQRRSQILPEAFEFLFHEFSERVFYNQSLYKGYRLVACDGTDLNIPLNQNDETTYFKSTPTEKGFNQLHMNALFDLLTRQYIDAIIQPARLENEVKAFCNMIDRYDRMEKTIFISDRAYEAYNVFAHCEEKGMSYLIRAKDINSTGILSGLSLPTSHTFDVSLSFSLTRKQTKEIKANRQKYKFIPANCTFDYLDSYDQKFYPIKLRVLRFSISDNSYECIITNLPANEFSIDEIKRLYHMRWGIETSFRELKYAIGMTCFHSKKIDYIKQEIWARLILYNFCEIVTTSVIIEQRKTKYVYRLNYTMAIHICQHFLAVKPWESPPEPEQLIQRELLPVRPGRTNPRKVKPQSVVSFLYRAA